MPEDPEQTPGSDAPGSKTPGSAAPAGTAPGGQAAAGSEWGEAWRELIDRHDVEVRRRLRQGHAFHRAGRTADLRVSAGRATVRVQDARATPYTPELELPALDEESWGLVVEVLAAQLRHSARLLAGHAPEGVDAELAGTGLRLFPRRDEITTACDCPDRTWPCAHVAALWEALGDALDSDPFVLLRLRGRGRERLLAELADARRRRARGEVRRAVALDELDTARWTRARDDIDGLGVPAPEPPRTPAGTLRLLGDPPGWAGGVDAWQLFHPLVEGAAAWAEAIDRAEADELRAGMGEDADDAGTGDAGEQP